MRQTTKICPECKSTALILLRSQNIKICSNCNKQIPWTLDPGQKPIK